MKSLRHLLLGALVVVFALNSSQAQSYRGWSVSLKGGVTKALTDIRTFDFAWAKDGDQKELKFGGQLALTKMFNASFGLQADGWYGKLEGIAMNNPPGEHHFEDIKIAEKLGFSEGDVYFATNISGGAINLYMDLNSIAMQLNMANHKPNAKRIVGFYGMIGYGVDHFDSEIRNVDNDELWDTSKRTFDTLQSGIKTYVGGYLRGQSFDTWETEWPITMGVKFKLSRMFDLGFEGTVHNMVTDKLDGYVGDLGNSFKKNNDRYMTLDLSLTIKFVGKDAEYIEWKDPTDDMYDDINALNEQMKKLTADTDNDGVPDMFDKEPNTPQGFKVYGSGESVDSDKDGVPDGKDNDLFSPKGCTVNTDGMPADDDGDGVPNCLDKEASTPHGNMVNFQGVTIPKGGGGAAIGYTLPTIFFDTDKSDVKPMYYPELAGVASTMKANPSMKIKITGNCDERASESYNQALGQRRADAAKNFLVKYYGIDGSRISTESKGEANPLYKPLYSINRRVDFTEVK